MKRSPHSDLRSSAFICGPFLIGPHGHDAHAIAQLTCPAKPGPGRTITGLVYAVANPIRRTFRSVPAPGFEPIVASLAPRTEAEFSLAAISAC